MTFLSFGLREVRNIAAFSAAVLRQKLNTMLRGILIKPMETTQLSAMVDLSTFAKKDARGRATIIVLQAAVRSHTRRRVNF